MTILAVATFWKVFSSVIFLLICFLLVVIVLLQKGRGGGLSGAFGGAGGHSAFGAKTGDFFTWLTVCLAGLFLVVAIVNNFAFRKVTLENPPVMQEGQVPPGPGAQPAPALPSGGESVPVGTPDGGTSAPPGPSPAPVQGTDAPAGPGESGAP